MVYEVEALFAEGHYAWKTYPTLSSVTLKGPIYFVRLIIDFFPVVEGYDN